MKLFIREHTLLMIVQCIQFSVIVGLFWLAGFRDMQLAIYSVFLGLFFLGGYLAYQYMSRKAFYKRLSSPVQTFDESFQSLQQAPIAVALQRLLLSQYKLYKEDIVKQRLRQDEHIIFMDRWIHQMKTPLSVIELIAQDLDEPDSSSVREETDRIKTGLNTVLYMARFRSFEADFHITRVELRKLLQEVNNDHKRLFIRNQIYPEIHEAVKKPVIVESDEKWLFFILTQIIQNAVKYSDKTADKVSIYLYQRSNRSICEIKDDGVGIPPEDMKRIFDPFFTGANGRKFRESTGVGLYLVKEVADYLGHRIEVESIVGQGTIFRIVF